MESKIRNNRRVILWCHNINSPGVHVTFQTTERNIGEECGIVVDVDESPDEIDGWIIDK